VERCLPSSKRNGQGDFAFAQKGRHARGQAKLHFLVRVATSMGLQGGRLSSHSKQQSKTQRQQHKTTASNLNQKAPYTGGGAGRLGQGGQPNPASPSEGIGPSPSSPGSQIERRGMGTL